MGQTSNQNFLSDGKSFIYSEDEAHPCPLVSACHKEIGAIDKTMYDTRQYLSETDIFSLILSCRYFYTLLNEHLDRLALKALLVAVVDDNHARVKRLLKSKRSLLRNEIPEEWVLESQLNRQRFFATDVLQLSIERKQLGMLTLLFNYYDKMVCQHEITKREVAKIKIDALNKYTPHPTRLDQNNEPSIQIDQADYAYIKKLIDIFKREPIDDKSVDYLHLSDETENEIMKLHDLLFIKIPTHSKKMLNVSLFLLAANKVYFENIKHFPSKNQEIAFSIRVIGLIQRALSAELAKVFCEGVLAVTEWHQQTGDNANAFRLQSGDSFYSSRTNDSSGVGYEYLCHAADGNRSDTRGWYTHDGQTALEQYLLKQNLKVNEMLAVAEQEALEITKPCHPCIIL